jgi:hypothetical protein
MWNEKYYDQLKKLTEKNYSRELYYVIGLYYVLVGLTGQRGGFFVKCWSGSFRVFYSGTNTFISQCVAWWIEFLKLYSLDGATIRVAALIV